MPRLVPKEDGSSHEQCEYYSRPNSHDYLVLDEPRILLSPCPAERDDQPGGSYHIRHDSER